MSRRCRFRPWRQWLLVAWFGLAATPVAAQHAAVAAPNDTSPVDVMPGMTMPAQSTTTPVPAHATSTPPADLGQMPGMDHASMPGMAMPASTTPTSAPAHAAPAQPATSNEMPGVDHASMPGMSHGGILENADRNAATEARAAQGDRLSSKGHDYAIGAGGRPAHTLPMDMNDDAFIGMLLIDQFEAYHRDADNGQRWAIEGHYGNDENKLWLRSEGEHSGGSGWDTSTEAFWNHAVGPFWNAQLGARADAGQGPPRGWAAFGIQGLTPYWFELEATGYVGSAGRTAARLRVEYELLLTQRLILQPEFEANTYGKADPARRLGSGIADGAFGLRLRYEFNRQLAPYFGVAWTRRFGRTADFAHQDGKRVRDRQWVAGIRLWF